MTGRTGGVEVHVERYVINGADAVYLQAWHVVPHIYQRHRSLIGGAVWQAWELPQAASK